ncbi:sulfur carrier protein ThiS [Mixta theicola]|uniref:Sulfur carrier protein ThiS n=1 Tax=Mixta theicola TaxID=1458355 RepID=A0A2K1Q4S4_9GAMM|nr:sulfur carrier protein ThiS [Mixta theicola]PNS10048.1 sulfur carrier protein ThiS [Mixta theicola]GLR09018.1 sulfur carrier protein ThiS [Mixta theicola]
MNILVNDETLTLEAPLTLDRLLDKLDCQPAGTALAVNQQIIPHGSWSQHALCEGDVVVIFQAIAGG